MSTRPHRYRSLAQALAQDLRSGRYPPGSQLPSVRQLCSAHAASLATVTHALHELEDAGLIEARPRRGFFACAAMPVPGCAPAAEVIALAGRRKRLMELAASQPGLLSLGHLGLPASLLPLPALARLAGQQLRSQRGLLATGSVYGSAALREQLALRAPRMGCRFGAEDIVLTQGEGESLQLCLRLLTQPGDLVALSTPAPLRALELIASLGLHVLELSADSQGGLDLPALDAALARERIAVLVAEPSFHRANAGLLGDAAKQGLAALLSRHELPLIECDMMGELYRGTQRPAPVKAFDSDERVLYCGSLACITGPGYSLGYIASARHHLQLRAARAVHGELLPSSMDEVLAAFMASGGFDTHLRRLRRCLTAQVQAYERAALAHFPAGTRVSTGAGGYVLWVELPAPLDTCVLLELARAQGINFMPGAVFSMGTQFDHCLRLSAAHPLDAQRAQALRLLGELAQQLLGGWQASSPA
ncbi:aminotransferase-like domain-containing protein [Paucibacter soli]|uniref:aminotransferase-like domain-containing protein n=1 Tax=Paucibacter soli TaxID=3133433 RepID=UPI0030A5627E